VKQAAVPVERAFSPGTNRLPLREGGHGGAADNKQAAFMAALAFTFLWQQLR